GGTLSPVALEVITRARQLGSVTAVVLGPGARSAAESLGKYGADQIYISEDERLAEYPSDVAVQVMADQLAEARPELCLFSSMPNSRDVAGRLAARLGVGAVANALSVEIEGENIRATVPYFGGDRVATLRINHRPALVMLRPQSYAASPTPTPFEVEEIQLEGVSWVNSPQVISREREAAKEIQLERAEVVVAGGRGLGSRDNFRLVEALAATLRGAAGASRAIVDAGWVSYALQIGQTGKTVRPKVYLGAGISGAMQHTVGMNASELIIAINKDPDAPIFKLADVGVVGDALRILPELIAAVEKARSG
ncbi:MAG: electron transfer flavoprotein subunit alpha/FixB family protein, partial [Candidatus Dormibacteraceae bacterium]